MKTITLFNAETGLFGAILTVPDSALPRQNSYKIGRFHSGSQRVDVATGEVVAYEPPRDHVAEGHLAARAIMRAEAKQNRAVREALLVILPDGPEKARLQKIDDEIAAKRGDL